MRSGALAGVLQVVGLAMWWPFLRNSISGAVFADADPSGATFGAFLLVSAVLALVCVVVPCVVGGAERRRWPLVVLCAGASLMLALKYQSDNPVVAWLALALFAGAYVVLPIAWANELYGSLGWNVRRVLLVLIGSYALSFAVGLLSYAGYPWNLIRPVGAPVVSGVCWWLASSLPTAGRWGNAAEPPVVANLTALCVFAVVLNCIGSVPIGFLQVGSGAYDPNALTLARDCLNIVLAVCLLLAVAVSRRFENVLIPSILVLAAFILGGVAVASLAREDLFTVGVGCLAAGKSCFSILLFILAYVLGFRGLGWWRPARTFCVLLVLPTLASTLVWVRVVPWMVSDSGIGYSDFWGVLSLLFGGVVCVCLIGLLALIAMRVPRSVGDGGSYTLSVADAVAAVGGEHRLTPREQELLGLLCEGNTFKRAGELLSMSPSTVQTHSKSIYRKLDIHTKQEAIDLVSAVRSGSHSNRRRKHGDDRPLRTLP